MYVDGEDGGEGEELVDVEEGFVKSVANSRGGLAYYY